MHQAFADSAVSQPCAGRQWGQSHCNRSTAPHWCQGIPAQGLGSAPDDGHRCPAGPLPCGRSDE
eukprot:2884042-Rhodomonas_salina.1